MHISLLSDDHEFLKWETFPAHISDEKTAITSLASFRYREKVLHVIPKHSDRNIKAILPKCMSGLFSLPVTVVPATTTALEVLLLSPVA